VAHKESKINEMTRLVEELEELEKNVSPQDEHAGKLGTFMVSD
jgi:hypothetical protein